MPFTFECGVCHSPYRLDEQQITANGVKITCPKCLNFFILKRNLETTERPTVERIISDGAHEIRTPPPPPGVLTADRLLTDSDLETAEIPPKSVPGLPPLTQVTVPDFSTKTEVTIKVRKEELADYPTDVPPQGMIEQYFIPVSLILIVLSGLLYMNYEGVIRVPGLESLRAPKPGAVYVPKTDEKDDSRPKYGFPKVDSTYDAWSDKGPRESATEVPSDETSPSPSP